MRRQSDIERDLLPPTLREIHDAAGPEAVLAIVKEYGGQRVKLPIRSAGDNWLVRLVGATAAASIIDRFGGGGFNIDMPLGTRWRRERQAAAIDTLHANVPATARALGITERTVRNQRARRRARLDSSDNT